MVPRKWQKAVRKALCTLRSEGVVRARPRCKRRTAKAAAARKGEARRRIRVQLLNVGLQLHKLILLELRREGVLEAARVASPRLSRAGGERPAVGATAQPLL